MKMAKIFCNKCGKDMLKCNCRKVKEVKKPADKKVVKK
jgi:hypothetical protein